MKYVRLEVLHKDLTEEGRRKVITLISCILFRFLFEDKIHIKVLFFSWVGIGDHIWCLWSLCINVRNDDVTHVEKNCSH